MAAWSDGYFTDVQYTGLYYDHMAPGALLFAMLRRGVRPPTLGPGATYLELGCGQGFGLNLLAAANPHIQFIGIDFHPGQIANARALAAEAGLTNIVFEDLSFEQVLALPDGRLPKCEVIAAHGVLSWISTTNRGRVVRVLDRLLQPGGIAVLSYNAYPGWSAFLALQQFVRAYVARAVVDPRKAVMEALRTAQRMATAEAGIFRSPEMKAYIAQKLTSDPAYVLHELANDEFHPLLHADLARELASARLAFAAQVRISDDSTGLMVPQPLQAEVDAAEDSQWRETLADFAAPRVFRRDIFVRGYNPMSLEEQVERRGALRFALTVAPDSVGYEFKVPIGTLRGDPNTYGSIVTALAERPHRYDELAALSSTGRDSPNLQRAVALLLERGAIHPLTEPEPDLGPAQAFNQAILRRFRREGVTEVLAAPRIGGGVPVAFADLLALAEPTGCKGDHRAALDLGSKILSRSGARMQKDGLEVTDPAEATAILLERIETFETVRRPILAALGVV
jgi:SAM-dependent methyltransferase